MSAKEALKLQFECLLLKLDGLVARNTRLWEEQAYQATLMNTDAELDRYQVDNEQLEGEVLLSTSIVKWLSPPLNTHNPKSISMAIQ